MNWCKKKLQAAYLKAKGKRNGEKGGMEITTVIGLVIVAIVVLVIAKNMFVKTTKNMSKSTEDAIGSLYDEKASSHTQNTSAGNDAE